METPTNHTARWKGLPADALKKTGKARCTPSPLPSEEQDRLVLAYLPLARAMAAILKSAHPRWRDEFESAAGEGLVEAARRYDPSLGSFPAYAEFRIRARLADVLRSIRRPLPARLPIGLEVLAEGPEVGSELELLEEVPRLLGRLPEREAQAIRLIFLEGRTQAQAARALGVSQVEVSRMQARSLRLLRRRLSCCA